jgi:hypothetical protein
LLCLIAGQKTCRSPRFRHLYRQTTRHERTVWYFRRNHGRRVRIHGEYGGEAFLAAYARALAGKSADTALARAGDGSLLRALKAAHELGAKRVKLAKDGTIKIELTVLPPERRTERERVEP